MQEKSRQEQSRCVKCASTKLIRANETMALVEVRMVDDEPTLVPGSAFITRPRVCPSCGFVELYAAAAEAGSVFPKIELAEGSVAP